MLLKNNIEGKKTAMTTQSKTNYMLTKNGNYIVNNITNIDFPITDQPNSEVITKKLTRVAFFTKDYKFIKLTEFSKWIEIKKEDRIIFNDEIDLFVFPEISALHFLNEITKNSESHRVFYRWKKTKKCLIPEILYFLNGERRLVIKYDIFNNRILENKHNLLKFYNKLLPSERRGTFDKWSLYIVNCFKYRLKNKKQIGK
jgi:hypothetical protein